MICRVGPRRFAGRAVDLAASTDLDAALDPVTVARAVRDGRATTDDGTVVTVDALDSGPLHDRVGCVTPACSIQTRTALALAARSRGWTTPVDDRIAAAQNRLDAHRIEPSAPETAEHRRDLAANRDDVDRLRERAAEARGRVQAGDGPVGSGTSPDDSPLADAIRDLSEAETAVAALRERHRAARATARSTRDRLQERLRLTDDLENAQREARSRLVDRARGCYQAALREVPGYTPDPDADPFAAPPDAMVLAVARVGDLAAPVVSACNRFSSAAAAARWLGAPVVRL